MSTTSSRRSGTHIIIRILALVLILMAWATAPILIFLVGGHGQAFITNKLVQCIPLLGALLGGTLTLFVVTTPARRQTTFEAWLGSEQWAWIAVGCGMLLWSAGESIRLFFLSQGQQPFPSYADIGYSSFLLLLLLGILLQPSSRKGRRRFLLLLDVLIATGPLLVMTLPFYLELAMQSLATIDIPIGLKLYYLYADMLLLACVALLLLRSPGRNYQVRARRASLFVSSFSLCFLVVTTFIVYVHPYESSLVVIPWTGTHLLVPWSLLGWPIGMLTLGIAASLRRFLPATPEHRLEQRLRRRSMRTIFGPIQLIPYIPMVALFTLVLYTIFAFPHDQQTSIGAVLIITTLIILLIRQLLTLMMNERLTRLQTDAREQQEIETRHHELEKHLIESRLHAIEGRNAEIAIGITYLKEVQAQLANGDLHARARLVDGELLSLAGGMNLMADRLMHLEDTMQYALQLVQALSDLSAAIEEYRTGAEDHVIVPASCNDIPEIARLVLALGLKHQAGRQGTQAFIFPNSPSVPTMAHTPRRMRMQPLEEGT